MTCCNCNDSLTPIVSVTNMTYYYCSSCKFENDKIFKNIAIDSILAQLCKSLRFTNTNYIKIEVILEGNKLNLLINNICLQSIDFNYILSKTDIYFLENTINDLVQDFSNVENKNVDVLICA